MKVAEAVARKEKATALKIEVKRLGEEERVRVIEERRVKEERRREEAASKAEDERRQKVEVERERCARSRMAEEDRLAQAERVRVAEEKSVEGERVAEEARLEAVRVEEERLVAQEAARTAAAEAEKVTAVEAKAERRQARIDASEPDESTPPESETDSGDSDGGQGAPDAGNRVAAEFSQLELDRSVAVRFTRTSITEADLIKFVGDHDVNPYEARKLYAPIRAGQFCSICDDYPMMKESGVYTLTVHVTRCRKPWAASIGLVQPDTPRLDRAPGRSAPGGGRKLPTWGWVNNGDLVGAGLPGAANYDGFASAWESGDLIQLRFNSYNGKLQLFKNDRSLIICDAGYQTAKTMPPLPAFGMCFAVGSWSPGIQLKLVDLQRHVRSERQQAQRQRRKEARARFELLL